MNGARQMSDAQLDFPTTPAVWRSSQCEPSSSSSSSSYHHHHDDEGSRGRSLLGWTGARQKTAFSLMRRISNRAARHILLVQSLTSVRLQQTSRVISVRLLLWSSPNETSKYGGSQRITLVSIRLYLQGHLLAISMDTFSRNPAPRDAAHSVCFTQSKLCRTKGRTLRSTGAQDAHDHRYYRQRTAGFGLPPDGGEWKAAEKKATVLTSDNRHPISPDGNGFSRSPGHVSASSLPLGLQHHGCGTKQFAS
ncbi:hypothetical protein BDW60DRAFT_126196 [Aspergillus nidulans var. acristatus]